MFLVRNIFHAKPGKAKELVAIFKKAAPLYGVHGRDSRRAHPDGHGGHILDRCD